VLLCCCCCCRATCMLLKSSLSWARSCSASHLYIYQYEDENIVWGHTQSSEIVV
jgi:hypothetical protein